MDMLVTKNSVSAIRAELKILPSEVDDTYRSAMDRIAAHEKEVACRILMWITYAVRNLSVRELQHAIATSPGMTNIDSNSIVPEHLLTSICAGLVVIERDVVRLVRKCFIHGIAIPLIY
jgi:hypothetical protein